MKIYVREFLEVDISDLDYDEALTVYDHAKGVRELRVEIMQEAIVRAFKKR